MAMPKEHPTGKPKRNARDSYAMQPPPAPKARPKSPRGNAGGKHSARKKHLVAPKHHHDHAGRKRSRSPNHHHDHTADRLRSPRSGSRGSSFHGSPPLSARELESPRRSSRHLPESPRRPSHSSHSPRRESVKRGSTSPRESEDNTRSIPAAHGQRASPREGSLCARRQSHSGRSPRGPHSGRRESQAGHSPRLDGRRHTGHLHTPGEGHDSHAAHRHSPRSRESHHDHHLHEPEAPPKLSARRATMLPGSLPTLGSVPTPAEAAPAFEQDTEKAE